jgi:phosphopantetheine--protein transferase-like protein
MITVEIINVENFIPKENEVDDFRSEVKGALKYCSSASGFLERFPPIRSQRNFVRCCSYLCDQTFQVVDKPLSRSLQAQIFRYFRISDQYQSYLSLLLKSREFYQAYPSYRQRSLGLFSVIDLPKTREGKPFIPSETGQRSEHEFSLSHQYPYIGIARIKGKCIGFDIVILEDLDKNIAEIDYIRSFQSSFGESEWDSITTSKSKSREFLLRWCMKESYTKAIGLGLGLNFQSFIINLQGAPKHWWEYVFVSGCKEGYHKTLGATICHGKNKRRGNEDCLFSFIPIFSDSNIIRGCASICIPITAKENDIKLNISCLNVDDLIKSHGSTGKEQKF